MKEQYKWMVKDGYTWNEVGHEEAEEPQVLIAVPTRRAWSRMFHGYSGWRLRL
jgi:hypothetical protein